MRETVAVPVIDMDRQGSLVAGGKEAVQKDLAGVQDAPVVAAHKAGCPFFKMKACEGVEGRLIGHGQDVYCCRVWQGNPVFRDTGVIRREHMRKEGSHIEKEIEEGAVVLVPEKGRDMEITRKVREFRDGP